MKLIEKHRSKLEKYEPLCKEIGEKPADVALAWLLHNPVVTCADHRSAHHGTADGTPHARWR